MTEPKKPVVSPAKDGVNSANLSARLFGERLKALRKKMELKQTVFAESIGTSEDTISEIERGLLSPRLDMLCKIAEQFGMTVSQLLDFQDEPKTKPAVNQALTALNLYLKTKLPQEVQLVHDMAKNVLNKAPSIYLPVPRPRGTQTGQKPGRPYGTPVGRKPFIMRDK